MAEHLHFRRAAEALFLSQPALSAQIRSLEELVAARLFERDRRRVLVTPAGEELARRARAILAELDDLAGAARALGDPLTGLLRLGVIPTIAPYLLPRALPLLRRRFPGLRIALREERTGALVAELEAGRLDLALVALQAELGDLETASLYDDPFFAVVPRGHPLAGRRRLESQDLADETLLLLEDGHCLRDQALALCDAAGAREAVDFRASSLHTLVQMVANGVGVTLVPSIALGPEGVAGERGRRGPVRVPLRPGLAGRTIALAWRRGSPRTELFARVLELLREHPPPGAAAVTA